MDVDEQLQEDIEVIIIESLALRMPENCERCQARFPFERCGEVATAAAAAIAEYLRKEVK